MKIGDEVLANGKTRGVVKFGPAAVKFADGTWVGLELKKPIGEHNGTFKGHEYFKCKDDYGMFVKADSVQIYNEQTAAANKIASVGRSKIAKNIAKNRANQKTWNTLENHQEQLNLRRHQKVKDASVTLKKEASRKESERKLGNKNVDEDKMEIEADYDGPHLQWPLNIKMVLEMLEHFKHGRKLHLKYVLQVLHRSRKLIANMQTLEEIELPDEAATGKKTQLTVVGDLHGQLQDLFSIFAINGLPTKENWYLFNGDFVDRGDCGVEVVLTLFAFKLLYPSCIYFNRGNHESRNQNSWMGFEEEVLAKYNDEVHTPGAGRELYELFSSCFDCLPLAHLVEKKIFVVHGGLTARFGITLKVIKALKRKREPPLHGSAFEERLIEDLLWSDPRNISGTQPSERGAGIEFGQEITNNFCAVNSVALIIRSHECVMEGFEVLHGGRLITLFSASRYCGTQTNKGAFLTLGKDLQPAIQQFYAHSIQSTNFTPDTAEESAPAAQERLDHKLEDDVVNMIIERVMDNKPSLFWYFTQHDEEKTGTVSRVEWSNALRNVLGLDVTYLTYQTRLAETDAEGRINYANFLERYQIKMADAHSNWQEGVVRKICVKLFRALGAGNIEEAFDRFDTDGDKYIEYEEFMNTLQELDVGLSDQQIYELMRSVDVNNDSKIDFQEFAERFQVVFDQMANHGLMHLDDATLEILNRIGTAMYSKFENLEITFENFDTDKSGDISFDEFIQGLETLELNPKISPEDARSVLQHIDIDSSGQIDYKEFVKAFKITDSQSNNAQNTSSWQQSVLQQVANVLFQHRIHLRSAFRMFDMDNSGTITAEEFQKSLATINTLLDSPLTEDQIDELLKALDTDGDGTLSYKEFFDGFRIVDSRLENIPDTSEEAS